MESPKADKEAAKFRMAVPRLRNTTALSGSRESDGVKIFSASACARRQIYAVPPGREQDGDGSSTTGFFISDVLQYNQASDDGWTSPANASITFGLTSSGSQRFNREKEGSLIDIKG